MKDPAWTGDADAKSLTAEAVVLIEGRATSPAAASQPAGQPAFQPESLPAAGAAGAAE